MTRPYKHSRLALFAAVSLVTASITGSCFRRSEPPNLVVIVVDTLRADRLSLYGNSRVTSPRLDAWATTHGVVFENVVAAAPLTLPAHVSIFSGLDAHRHGVNHDGRVPGSIPLLAPLLQKAGYSTVAVTGGGYLHPRFGLDRGFDQFHYWSEDAVDPPVTELESNVDLALELIDTLDQEPFFLFFHTYEVHDPYLPRSPFFEELHGDAPPPILSLDHHREHGPEQGFVDQRRLGILQVGRPGSWSPLPPEMAQIPYDLYDSSIAFTDFHLSRLLERLRELNDTRPTLVIFTSDHGEMLGEQGIGGHAALQIEALRVPLVMAFPDGRFAGTRFSYQARSTDLLPTILDVLGLAPLPRIDGVSLLSALNDFPEQDDWNPTSAWSYASKPNLGLVVRGEGELNVHFNHTVWEPARRDPRVVRNSGVAVNPEDPTDPWAEQARKLVTKTVTRLEEEIPGLRIFLRNTGPDLISGELRGKAIHPSRIKSVDLPCACIEWLGDRRVRFQIPSSSSYTLILEQVAGTDLKVMVNHPEVTSFELDLVDLPAARSLVYSDGSWRWLEGKPGTGASAVSFWWSGGIPDPESVAETEVQDQLRRLGYLD